MDWSRGECLMSLSTSMEWTGNLRAMKSFICLSYLRLNIRTEEIAIPAEFRQLSKKTWLVAGQRNHVNLAFTALIL